MDPGEAAASFCTSDLPADHIPSTALSMPLQMTFMVHDPNVEDIAEAAADARARGEEPSFDAKVCANALPA